MVLARYQIMRMGANAYLKIDWFRNNTRIRIKYTKKYEDLIKWTSFLFPDKYGVTVVAYVVAWTLAYDKWMPQAEKITKWETYKSKSYVSILYK